MRSHDNVTPDGLRADLRHFADLIVKLDAEGQLLDAAPHLLKILGDLRAKIFAHEVRFTGRLSPRVEADASPQEAESRRIIEEAAQREREARDEWRRRPEPGREIL
jgi:hypothetical protein